MTASPDDRRVGGRVWAAMMLALRVETFEAILLGRPVMVRGLARAALRRALRDSPPPAATEYLDVTVEMLDAVNEGGPFHDDRSPAS